jgi:hypothetical protein
MQAMLEQIRAAAERAAAALPRIVGNCVRAALMVSGMAFWLLVALHERHIHDRIWPPSIEDTGNDETPFTFPDIRHAADHARGTAKRGN